MGESFSRGNTAKPTVQKRMGTRWREWRRDCQRVEAKAARFIGSDSRFGIRCFIKTIILINGAELSILFFGRPSPCLDLFGDELPGLGKNPNGTRQNQGHSMTAGPNREVAPRRDGTEAAIAIATPTADDVRQRVPALSRGLIYPCAL